MIRHAVAPDVEGHHDFFERGVAGAFADPVDRALDLARAAVDGRDRVRDGQTEVVVAMGAEHHLVGVRHAPADAREEVA